MIHCKPINTQNNPPNMVLELSANGTMNMTDGVDTITGSYSTSGNQFTLVISQIPAVYSYGITDTLLRWNMADSSTVNGNVYRDETDYIFERY